MRLERQAKETVAVLGSIATYMAFRRLEERGEWLGPHYPTTERYTAAKNHPTPAQSGET